MTPLFPVPTSGLKNLSEYDNFDMSQYFVLHLMVGVSPRQAIEILEKDSTIAAVEPNYLYHRLESHLLPDDPYFVLHWNYHMVQLPSAWDITTGSSQVTVAVLDDGFQYDHPDLTGSFYVNAVEFTGLPEVDDDGNLLTDDILGWDFGDDDNDPYPAAADLHGTHVAGTIGALTNNTLGVTGVDWNCRILPIRVFNTESGGATAEDVGVGLYYATIMGARVINLSLGSYFFSQFQEDWLHFAYNSGVLSIAAAGNDNFENMAFPARSNYALAVGATDWQDERWVYDEINGSNYGTTLDLTAPGAVIMSTNPTWHPQSPSYGQKTGTSMAAPHVAGVASLILAVRPALSPDSLYAYLALGADDLTGRVEEDTPGWDQYHGWGRLNAYNSIRLALGQCVCKCFGDPFCDGQGPDVLDVVEIVNKAFRGLPIVTDFGCPAQRSDVNNDGETDVLDVVAVVNAAFRGSPAAVQFDDPCE
jgi:serine protease